MSNVVFITIKIPFITFVSIEFEKKTLDNKAHRRKEVNSPIIFLSSNVKIHELHSSKQLLSKS